MTDPTIGSQDGWLLADTATHHDLEVYLGRAARLDEAGAARVIGVGNVAAVYVCALHGSGGPTVLGLRTVALAAASELDLLIPIAALTDRLARAANGLLLPAPPQQVTAPWAGIMPPRGGWAPAGEIPLDDLRSAAAAGIAEIAAGAPEGSGAAAVSSLRARVWARPVHGVGLDLEVPAGAAFAAHALGFLTDGAAAAVHSSGRWQRLTTRGGYVLTRTPLL